MKCYIEFDKAQKTVAYQGTTTIVTLNARIMLSKIPGFKYFFSIPKVQKMLLKHGIVLKKQEVYVNVTGTGYSKLNPQDEYNKTAGYRIALTRAQATVFNKSSKLLANIWDLAEHVVLGGIENACIASEDAFFASKDHIADVIEYSQCK